MILMHDLRSKGLRQPEAIRKSSAPGVAGRFAHFGPAWDDPMLALLLLGSPGID